MRRYIPRASGPGLMPSEVATKWTLRHLSHMMPMWTGIGEIMARSAALKRMLVPVKKPLTPDEWIAVMIGGTVLLITFLLWLFLRSM